jgi:hypothetical protein
LVSPANRTVVGVFVDDKEPEALGRR